MSENYKNNNMNTLNQSRAYADFPEGIRAIFLNTPLVQLARRIVEKENSAVEKLRRYNLVLAED